jgi:outer membrane lipoprotein-sorting protein
VVTNEMKKAMVAMAVAMSLVFTGGVAMANSCPKLIKQGRDAAAKMDAKDPKVKDALAKLDEAQKLHENGQHQDSMAKANEALAELGVKKDSK